MALPHSLHLHAFTHFVFGIAIIQEPLQWGQVTFACALFPVRRLVLVFAAIVHLFFSYEPQKSIFRQDWSVKPHLETAKTYWKSLLLPTDTVIDATCGNGHDTAFLASLVPQGTVYSLDIQPQALEKARLLAPFPHVVFLQQSHIDLPQTSNVKLIVYNLGYLPGGDKSITTQTETTIESVRKSLNLLVPGGAVTITCYPGHPEGARETEALSRYLSTLPYPVRRHDWKPEAPIVFHIQK